MERLETLWERTPLRRAFYALAAVVLFVGVVAALNARSSSAGPSLPTVPGGPSQAEAAYGKKIPLPPDAEAAVQQFVHGAVLRQDLGAAWKVSSGSVHGDVSRSQWLTGTIPVLPFPAKAFQSATVKTVYSRERGSLLLVTIRSKDPAVRFQEFFTELARTGDGWKIVYWGPRGTNPPIPKSRT
jgi:hypothetical protein